MFGLAKEAASHVRPLIADTERRRRSRPPFAVAVAAHGRCSPPLFAVADRRR